MQADLRKLFWRVKTGFLHRSKLEDAVEESCNRLVSLRFSDGFPRLEVSPYSRPHLARFEDEILRARLWAPEGEHRRAVRAVEGAVSALDAARLAAEAHSALDEALAFWTQLEERYELSPLGALPTLREVRRTLKLARSFLEEGESRKALFVSRLGLQQIDRLTTPDPNTNRREALSRRSNLIGRTNDYGPFMESLTRLRDEGLLGFVERLLDDWEMVTQADQDSGGAISAVPEPAVRRIVETGRQAQAIKRALSALIPAEVDEGVDPETEESRKQSPTGG
jgi:hypothetical protein